MLSHERVLSLLEEKPYAGLPSDTFDQKGFLKAAQTKCGTFIADDKLTTRQLLVISEGEGEEDQVPLLKVNIRNILHPPVASMMWNMPDLRDHVSQEVNLESYRKPSAKRARDEGNGQGTGPEVSTFDELRCCCNQRTRNPCFLVGFPKM